MLKIIFKYTCIMCIILFSYYAYGNDLDGINGVVKDSSSQPIQGATVSLLKAKDSSLVEQTLTNEPGIFHFTKQLAGKYIICVQAISYESFYTSIIDYDSSKEIALPTVYLHRKVAILNEIVVKAQKSLIQQKAGKMIVNVASSITSAGKSVWDVLQSAPGVAVDHNNAISVQGKNGVMILIDGKPTYMSADQVVVMLKNMDVNNIQSIEIMSRPSSQYDAQGSAGIINIITKKSIAKGTSGSISGSYNQGEYPKYVIDGNISHRVKRINFYGSLNYNNAKGYNDQDISRRFYNLTVDTLISKNQQSIHKYMRNNYLEYKAGLDYYFSDKSVLGIMFNSATTHSIPNATNESKTFSPNNTFGGSSISNSKTKDSWRNNILHANYKKDFDSLGKSIHVDLVYAKFKSHSDQLYITSYLDQDNNEYVLSNMMGSLPLDINIKAGKIDYSLPFNKNTKIAFGMKSSFVETNNSVEYDTLTSANKWVRDSNINNRFVYKENINAAYVNFDIAFDRGWVLQIGLRGELTNAKGHQYTPDSTNDRNYFQLFPSLFIQKKFNQNHAIGLSYGRRIDRPDYQDLNPFRYYLDPYLYNIGNPFLQSQITNSIGASYSFKNYFTASLSYSYTTDAMIQVLHQDTRSTMAYLKQSNLKNIKNLSLNISSGIPVTNWFTTNNSVNLFRNSTEGLYQKLHMHYGQISLQFNSTNIFKLPKNYSIEVSGFYNSKVLYGLLFMKKQYQLSLGVQKSLFKNQNGSVKFSVSDIFKNLSSGGGMHVNNLINTDFMNHWDSRRAALTFTYRFSKGSKIADRSSLDSDEQNRIKK